MNEHDRSLLHVNQIEPFKEWLREQGYEILPGKGIYEVFRAKKGDAPPVIIHRRSWNKTTKQGKLVHLTVWGEGLKLARQFIREKRKTGR